MVRLTGQADIAWHTRTVNAAEYLERSRARMEGAGFQVIEGAVVAGAHLIGYKSEFRLSWMATKLHLFVTVKAVPVVRPADIAPYAEEVLEYGRRVKGRWLGFQTGVAAIPVLVGDAVDADAEQIARTQLFHQQAGFAWPVVVDLGRGERFAHRGNPVAGRLYNSWMRQQIEAALPL